MTSENAHNQSFLVIEPRDNLKYCDSLKQSLPSCAYRGSSQHARHCILNMKNLKEVNHQFRTSKQCFSRPNGFQAQRLVLRTILTFGIHAVAGNLLVVLLQSSQIFTSLAEFTLLHTLSDIPMYKGSL